MVKITRKKLTLLLAIPAVIFMLAGVSKWMSNQEQKQKWATQVAYFQPGTPENTEAISYAKAYEANPKRQAAYKEALKSMGVRPDVTYPELMKYPEPSTFLLPGISPLGSSTGVETASSQDFTRVVPRNCNQVQREYIRAFPYEGDKTLWDGTSLQRTDAEGGGSWPGLPRVGSLYDAVMSYEVIMQACTLVTDKALSGPIYKMQGSFKPKN